MRPKVGDRLYSPLVRSYRRKATGTHIALIMAALALSAAAVYAHYHLVVQPSRADLALRSIPYQPWYLDGEPMPARRNPAIGATSVGDNPEGVPTAATVPVGQPPGRARLKILNPARPNLVPERAIGYSFVELAKRIQSYLGDKTGFAPNPDLAARAQELAESYASSAGAGSSEFPLPAALERSVLEQGWLWDLRKGCEAELYIEFPAGRLDAMGCGLAAMPSGKAFGVGVAFVERPGVGQRTVIVVVWENK